MKRTVEFSATTTTDLVLIQEVDIPEGLTAEQELDFLDEYQRNLDGSTYSELEGHGSGGWENNGAHVFK